MNVTGSAYENKSTCRSTQKGLYNITLSKTIIGLNKMLYIWLISTIAKMQMPYFFKAI